MKSGALWEFEPGELAKMDPAILHVFQLDEIRLHCKFYETSDDPVHLWRGWRAARVTGDIRPECIALLAPHFDKLASAPKNTTRADQRTKRNFLLLDYYHELALMRDKRPGSAANETAVRTRVGKRYGKSEGTVRQFVLKHEGRDGRRKP